MPPARQTYLLQDPAGRFHTVIAHSLRGAVKIWSARNPRVQGDVKVKVRGGADSWQFFRIS